MLKPLCDHKKTMEVPDRLTCLLRNLCVGQEATVTTTYWFKIGKGVQQDYMLLAVLFNLYA